MMLSQRTMTDPTRRPNTPKREEILDPLLSDEPTIELVIRAREGDRLAVEALLQRCLPPLKRWAHGKLPPAARGSIDTADLVQEAALHAVQRLDVFEPRHVGAMQAYLRMSVINRIRDEVRRITRHPAAVALPEDHPADATSPLESAIQAESYDHYRRALEHLKARDREMVVARVEVQWSLAEIAQRFGMPSVDAARMAVTRALKRLSTHMTPSA
ncbi:MAG: sigma-70 family RNA polymerase sigma factor [Gemmatimonadetes bacterium]|nr:sigma-70 family RNA polymerase sigma factor [Gemmatimonadota bacterium]